MASPDPAAELAAAGYVQVPSVKNDPRLIPYWQRWEGLHGEMDWFEFPHDLPLELVWSIIGRVDAERRGGEAASVPRGEHS